MPIKIPESLPGRAVLEQENIPLILEDRAIRQDIRPLRVLILNLMPDKIGTEVQLLRALGLSPLQIEITSCMPQRIRARIRRARIWMLFINHTMMCEMKNSTL